MIPREGGEKMNSWHKALFNFCTMHIPISMLTMFVEKLKASKNQTMEFCRQQFLFKME